MGYEFQPELWRELYVMLGTSSGALIGLLFIVTSFHLTAIKNNPLFRFRAFYTTVHLLLLFVEAMLILTPQSTIILGAEVVAINLFGLHAPINFVYNHSYKTGKLALTGSPSIYRSIPYFVAFLIGVAGGTSLIEQSNWGMYLVTIS
jgi:hypothetical protein